MGRQAPFTLLDLLIVAGIEDHSLKNNSEFKS